MWSVFQAASNDPSSPATVVVACSHGPSASRRSMTIVWPAALRQRAAHVHRVAEQDRVASRAASSAPPPPGRRTACRRSSARAQPRAARTGRRTTAQGGGNGGACPRLRPTGLADGLGPTIGPTAHDSELIRPTGDAEAAGSGSPVPRTRGVAETRRRRKYRPPAEPGYGLGRRLSASRNARAPSDTPRFASSPTAWMAVPTSSVPPGADRARGLRHGVPGWRHLARRNGLGGGLGSRRRLCLRARLCLGLGRFGRGGRYLGACRCARTTLRAAPLGARAREAAQDLTISVRHGHIIPQARVSARRSVSRVPKPETNRDVARSTDAGIRRLF